MADLTIGEHFFELTDSQDLSAGAFDYTTALNTDFALRNITFHATAEFTQEITVTLDSRSGVNYDTIIAKKTTSSNVDVVLSCCMDYKKGDEIRIQVANSGTPSTTVYMKLIAEQK